MMKSIISTLMQNAGKWCFPIGRNPYLLHCRTIALIPCMPDALLIFYCKVAIKHTIMRHGI